MAQSASDLQNGLANSWGSELRRRPNGQYLCPQFREHINNTCSRSTCNFLANLESSKYSAHYTCTKNECRSHIEIQDCKPTHWKEECDCELIGPPIEDLKTMVGDSKIPLLRFKTTLRGAYRIEVVEANYESRYIAVSHVWTGGLGNPTENRLYRCQLEAVSKSGRQIRKSIESFRPPSFIQLFRHIKRILSHGEIDLFWIDTLCIPVKEFVQGVETQESQMLRGKAIDRMTQIYGGAHSVWIIDPELRHVDNSLLESDPQKLFGLILRCDWMRRCWTYQEGAMARRHFVVLRDGPVYLTRERYKIIRDCRDDYDQSLLKELTNWVSELPAPREANEYESRHLISGTDPKVFAQVWNSLVARTTTHEGDRFLIFALMMNLIPGEIYQVKDAAQKLRTIFNSLTSVPTDFLFVPGLSRDGYWLPDGFIRGRLSTTSGRVIRDRSHRDRFILSYEDAKAGGDDPGLYLIKRQDLQTQRPHIIETGAGSCALRLRFERSEDREYAWTCGTSDFALLIKDRGLLFSESLQLSEARGALFIVDGTDNPDGLQLKHICGLTCVVSDDEARSVSLDDNLLEVEGQSVFIECVFGSAQVLTTHRNLDEILGGFVAVSQFFHLGSHLGIFYLAYCSIMTIIALVPSRASFGWGWVFLIWQFWGWQMVFDIFLVWLPGRRGGDKISHMQWLNNLAPELPAALPPTLRSMIHVNYGPWQTCFRLVIGSLFVVIGIWKFDRRSVRGIIALGLLIVLEVGFRWMMELVYNYYWQVRHPESHILVKEFLRDSRMTRWCKATFGWPKDLTEEDIERAKRQEFFGDMFLYRERGQYGGRLVTA